MTKIFLYNNKFAMVHISYYPSNDEPIGDFYGSFTIPQLNNRERFIDTDENKYQHAYLITQQLEELRENKASPWLNAVRSSDYKVRTDATNALIQASHASGYGIAL